LIRELVKFDQEPLQMKMVDPLVAKTLIIHTGIEYLMNTIEGLMLKVGRKQGKR
jgi:hypothetical protein